MSQDTRNAKDVCMGLDLGDRFSYLIGLRREGEVVVEERLRTDPESLRGYFAMVPQGTRVVCEAGTHSPWVSALLEELGLDVVVANPNHAGRALAANGRKNDRLDAVTLASLGLNSLRLLRPIRHRSPAAQEHLALIRARDAVVRTRTLLINAARSLVKTSGHRLPSSSAPSFHRKAPQSVPERLRPAVVPLLEEVGQLTAVIRRYDQEIEALCESYPETKRLQAINGVGALTALAFVLTIESPERFEKSRTVGAYLGLVPRQHESGASSPQLRITKSGDSYMRRLLVGSAQFILSSLSQDCDLKRFGKRLACRGGPRGKKQAAVAVARKLAVLMHRLWAKGESYDPFYKNHSGRRRSA